MGAIVPLVDQDARYLAILRESLRAKLDIILWKHLADQEHLDHYLEELGIRPKIGSLADPIRIAKEETQKCPWIAPWFNLEAFWKKQQEEFAGAKGSTAYQEILTRLMVALHGFWVFRLEDARHTFAFYELPSPQNEWGEEEGKAKVRIHFGSGVFYSPGEANNRKDPLDAALKKYLLRPGEGSVGLSLRADRGVCLRDTVRDLRGAVALEDCLMRNLAYLGVPLFLEGNIAVPRLGERGRPIGHFGLLFPCPLGWHKTLDPTEWCLHCRHPVASDSAEGKNSDPGLCLYRRVVDFCDCTVQPLAAQLYQAKSLGDFQTRVLAIAQLGDDPVFQGRDQEATSRLKRFLERVLPDTKTGVVEAPSVDELQAVQLWEQHDAAGRSTHGRIATDKEAETWRHSIRWKYPDVFLDALRRTAPHFAAKPNGIATPRSEEGATSAWDALPDEGFHPYVFTVGRDRLVLVLDQDGASGIENLVAKCGDIWRHIRQRLENARPPSDLPEFGFTRRARQTPIQEKEKESFSSEAVDDWVQSRKWRDMVTGHAADIFCARLMGTDGSISRLLFSGEDFVELQRRLQAIPSAKAIVAAFLIENPELHLDLKSVSPSAALPDRIQHRIRKELQYPHTLGVFRRLAELVTHIAGSSVRKKAPGLIREFRFRTNHPPHETQIGKPIDRPLSSQSYPSPCGHSCRYIDCGAETAFSVPRIWKAWFAELAPGSTAPTCPDLVTVRLDQNGIVSFSLSSSATPQTPVVRFSFKSQSQSPNAAAPNVAVTGCALERLSASLAGSIAKTDSYTLKLADKLTIQTANAVRGALLSCRNQLRRDGFVVLLALVAETWHLAVRDPSKPSDHPNLCNALRNSKTEEAFRAIATGADTNSPLGPDFGLTTHVFVPLYGPEETAVGREPGSTSTRSLVGFSVFSGSQNEQDTIRRVAIRPAQSALMTFANDYLEYLISQELQQHNLEASLHSFAHSLRRSSGHLRLGDLVELLDKLRSIVKRSGVRTGDFDSFFDKLGQTALPSDFRNILVTFLKSAEDLRGIQDMHFDHNVLINALTYVLAGRQETLSPGEGVTVPNYAKTLGAWVRHVANACKSLEEERHGIGCFAVKYSRTLTNSHLATFPRGSLQVILEEIFRNAGLHGKRTRFVTISIEERTWLTFQTCNVKSGSKPVESTGAGTRTIKRILSANCGEEKRGWIFNRSRKGQQVLIKIALDLSRFSHSSPSL